MMTQLSSKGRSALVVSSLSFLDLSCVPGWGSRPSLPGVSASAARTGSCLSTAAYPIPVSAFPWAFRKAKDPQAEPEALTEDTHASELFACGAQISPLRSFLGGGLQPLTWQSMSGSELFWLRATALTIMRCRRGGQFMNSLQD